MHSPIPSDLQQALAPILAEGEELLWASRPDAKSYAKHGSGPFRIILVPMIGMLVCMNAAMLTSDEVDWQFLTFSLVIMPGFLIFNLLMGGKSLRDRAKAIVYAVTDRRIIIASPRATWKRKPNDGLKVDEYGKGTVECVYLAEGKNGVGHIFLGGEVFHRAGPVSFIPGLIGVPDAKNVAKLILLQEYAPKTHARMSLFARIIARL